MQRYIFKDCYLSEGKKHVFYSGTVCKDTGCKAVKHGSVARLRNLFSKYSKFKATYENAHGLRVLYDHGERQQEKS